MEMDTASIVQAIAALVFVLSLIGLASIALRKHGGKIKDADEARLAVLEVLPLDPRTRLMLVRRDKVQHLIAVGQENVSVIESRFESPDHCSDDDAFDGPSLSIEKPANKKQAQELRDISEKLGRAFDA